MSSPSKMYASTNSSMISGPSWFTNLGASHHMTFDPLNLTVKTKYEGFQKVLVGNGDVLQIVNFGKNTFAIDKVHNKEFHLNNILHVPNITKNLLSAFHFTKDNSFIIEFHYDCYFVKDKCIGQILLQGLYYVNVSLEKRRHSTPFKSSQALLTQFKSSEMKTPKFIMWHKRVGNANKNDVKGTLNTVIEKPDVCTAC